MILDKNAEKLFFFLEANKAHIKSEFDGFTESITCSVIIPEDLYAEIKDISKHDDLEGILDNLSASWKYIEDYDIFTIYDQREYKLVLICNMTRDYLDNLNYELSQENKEFNC